MEVRRSMAGAVGSANMGDRVAASEDPAVTSGARQTGDAPPVEVSTADDAQPKSKMAERVAARIESEIMAKGWPVGTVLGSEPEMIARLGVSRAVFREGVRIVESHNVARMRRGPRGGLIVTAPSMESVEASSALFLDYANVEQTDMFEVRTALESTCLRQLFDVMDEAKIARLRAAIEAEQLAIEQGGTASSVARVNLHVLLAELTENPALALFVDVLVRLTQQRAKNQVPSDRSTAHEMHAVHVGIVEALIAGDLAVAQHRLAKHLEAVSAFYS